MAKDRYNERIDELPLDSVNEFLKIKREEGIVIYKRDL